MAMLNNQRVDLRGSAKMLQPLGFWSPTPPPTIPVELRIQPCHPLHRLPRAVEGIVETVVAPAVIRDHQGTLEGRRQKAQQGMRLVMVNPPPLLHPHHLQNCRKFSMDEWMMN